MSTRPGLGIQPASLQPCQEPGVVVCHLERQTGPPQIAGPVCGFHTGQSQIWFSGCLQTDRKKKLDGMIVILGDGSFVICLQHPSGLMQGAVKKLYLHPAVPYCFRKPLGVFFFPEYVLILGNDLQMGIKY